MLHSCSTTVRQDALDVTVVRLGALDGTLMQYCMVQGQQGSLVERGLPIGELEVQFRTVCILKEKHADTDSVQRNPTEGVTV